MEIFAGLEIPVIPLGFSLHESSSNWKKKLFAASDDQTLIAEDFVVRRVSHRDSRDFAWFIRLPLCMANPIIFPLSTDSFFRENRNIELQIDKNAFLE